MGLHGGLIIALASFAAFALAYFVYAEFVSRRLFGLRRDARMPSEEFEDGVDFVPTQRHILLGHHFTSVAGIAPIIGPALAVIWGWLPALLWVVLGGVFIGAVHDLGSLVVSVRSEGRSIGDLAGDILGRPGWLLFLCIIFSLLAVVIAVFGWTIAKLFVVYPASVLPIWAEIPIAMWLGYMVYERKAGVWRWSLVAVVLMFATIWIGTYVPISLGPEAGKDGVVGAVAGWKVSATMFWLVALLVYAFVASQLPVQKLLQPRDYINSHELYIGMLLLFAGMVAANPTLVAPAYRTPPDSAGAQPIFPMLFVIVACGAVSGFHSLVSSGTTSKQLRRETDAKGVGYGAMLIESTLSVLVIVACCAGLGLGLKTSGGEVIAGTEAYEHVYGSWKQANALKLTAFVTGGSHFLARIGVPAAFGSTLIAVILVSFAATTLDTATRIQRYVISELGRGLRLPLLKRRTVATTLAVLTAAWIAIEQGESGSLGLWTVFGTVNQLLAGLALMTVTLYLLMHAKPVLYTLIPMALVLVATGAAMVYQIVGFARAKNPMLLCLAGAVFLLELGVLAAGVRAYLRLRRAAAPPEAPPESPDSLPTPSESAPAEGGRPLAEC